MPIINFLIFNFNCHLRRSYRRSILLIKTKHYTCVLNMQNNLFSYIFFIFQAKSLTKGENLHRDAIIQGKEPLDIVFRSERDWKGYVARGVSGSVLYSLNCADLHPKYGYIVREGFEKKDISEIRAYHRNLVENTQI